MGEIQDGAGWLYTPIVKEHFMNPKNFAPGGVEDNDYDGAGEVGSPACGDMMKAWIKVEPESKRIIDCKWKTFGCASAIATTSMMSEMVLKNGGMTIDEAKELKAKDIVEALGGLPAKKIHCSVLGDQALHKAIEDYLSKK